MLIKNSTNVWYLTTEIVLTNTFLYNKNVTIVFSLETKFSNHNLNLNITTKFSLYFVFECQEALNLNYIGF